jgi:hypothetical protein
MGKDGTAVYQIMPYSLLYSVKELFDEAHMPLIALLVVIFSGILPYTKFVLMLSMWLVPRRLVSLKWRGRILLFLDQIGKYSLVDVFVVQFINGSFYTKVMLPAPDSSPGPDLILAARTQMDIGFLIFVLATVGSLIIGHICLYYHEKDPCVKLEHRARVQGSNEIAGGLDVTSRESLLSSCENLRDVELAVLGRQRGWVGPALLTLLALGCLSCIGSAFTVRMTVCGKEISRASYSILGYATRMKTFSFHSGFEETFSQFTFVLFVLCTISAHITAMIVIWYAKVPKSRWAAVNTLSHTLFAWSALDVMVLSMVLTLIEMTTSNFLNLDQMLNESQRHLLSNVLGFPVPADGKGVGLDVTLEWATYLVGMTVLVHAWLGRVVMSLLEYAVVNYQDFDDGVFQRSSPCISVSPDPSTGVERGDLFDPALFAGGGNTTLLPLRKSGVGTELAQEA